MRRPARRAALATWQARVRSTSSVSRHIAAKCTDAVRSSTSDISASLCRIAWKLPIGRRTASVLGVLERHRERPPGGDDVRDDDMRRSTPCVRLRRRRLRVERPCRCRARTRAGSTVDHQRSACRRADGRRPTGSVRRRSLRSDPRGRLRARTSSPGRHSGPRHPSHRRRHRSRRVRPVREPNSVVARNRPGAATKPVCSGRGTTRRRPTSGATRRGVPTASRRPWTS